MHIHLILAAAAAATLLSACSSTPSTSSTGRGGQAGAAGVGGGFSQSARAAAASQKEAGQQFQDALNYLAGMTGLQGGTHVTTVPQFTAKVQEAEASVALAQQQMALVDAAGPGSGGAPSAAVSRSLHSTHASLVAMLGRFRGEVRFLKANFNSDAITSMRGRTQTLQRDVQSLRAKIDRTGALAAQQA